jgi:hypothetical protein
MDGRKLGGWDLSEMEDDEFIVVESTACRVWPDHAFSGALDCGEGAKAVVD